MFRDLTPSVRKAVASETLRWAGVEMSPEFEACLLDPSREKVTTGGQQAGKSTLAAARVWVETPLVWRPPDDPHRYGFVVASYEAPHKEIDYLALWAGRNGMLDSYQNPSKGACRLSMMGGRIVVVTLTGQNPAGIAGEAYDGMSVVEAGQQSPEVEAAVQGRIITRRGWADFNGTLEDDEAHPRWAWFNERAQEWLDDPVAGERTMHALPTWANRTIFPGGEHDAEIERLRQRYDEWTFGRRVAGLPMGTQNAMYPPIVPEARKALYLRKLPEAAVWVDGAGGIDYGDVHPSAVTAVTVRYNAEGKAEAWVRACRFILNGDTTAIDEAKKHFTERFKVYRWGLDPLQRWVAGMSGEDTEAVRMGKGSRAGRIGITRSWLNELRLFYDMDGEGVPELYEEQRRVHYVKDAGGQLVHPRDKDDRTASLEDAMEVLVTVDHPPLPYLGEQRVSEAPGGPRPTDPYKYEDRRPQDPRADSLLAGLYGDRR